MRARLPQRRGNHEALPPRKARRRPCGCRHVWSRKAPHAAAPPCMPAPASMAGAGIPP